MRIACIILLGLCLNTLSAQKYDYVWMFGYDTESGSEDSRFGRSVMDFTHVETDSFLRYAPESTMNFFGTNASISDYQGIHQFAYNGVNIENKAMEIMQNGMHIGDSRRSTGDTHPQGGLALPWPERENIYALIHQSWEWIDFDIGIAGYNLYYSEIDMRSGNGRVSDRRNLIITDTMDFGKITATKHANGRDWWILVPRHDKTDMIRMLLTPEGVQMLERQEQGQVNRSGLGQAAFSPDGTKYLSYSAVDEQEGWFLHFYDFDRCTGLLSKPQTYHYFDGWNDTGGAVFSPDGTILYLFEFSEVYQFDLTADDVIASKQLVAERDNYYDTIPGIDIYFAPNFFLGQYAPDGRIYINSISSVKVLHTIDYPDVWGIGCQVNQHNIHLPTVNVGAMPHFPNYRLGPIDGSPCDTLGIDNMPLARWRADQDTESYLDFRFVDISAYEPAQWQWTFGDGGSSSQRHPTYSYAQGGSYEVCLTVSNENGSHTLCDSIHIGLVSATAKPNIDISVGVFPNPCRDFFNVYIADYYPQDAHIQLYDARGSVVRQQQLGSGNTVVDVRRLASGVYFYQVMDAGQLLASGKVIVK